MSRQGGRALALAVALLVAVPAGLSLTGPVAAAAETVRSARLDNGLTVLVRENPLAPVVALSLFVRMGTRWERVEQAGLSNFVQAVMVKGTKRRSGADLAEAVAALGGKISAAGDVDYSEIRASALARFWKEILGLTAELALEPVLSPDEVEREREWLLSRVQRRDDSPSSRAFDVFYATLYGAHPYAIPTLGTAASLKAIDHATIVAHYRASYRPERMVLAVSGQVKAAEVLAEANRLFGGLARGGGADDAPISPPVPSPRRVVIEQSSQQAQVLVGGLAPRVSDRDHAATRVLATVLGGGMAGRLFVELRDRRGLAYTATSFCDPSREPGALILYLGTSPENAAGAEAELGKEIVRITTQPVSAEELRRAKGYLLGTYVMDRRTNARQAWYLAYYDVVGVGPGFPERYRLAVESVTPEDVLRVARATLGSPTTVVLRPPAAR